MNITEQICHKAARFDAVAFDVFDTLIKRDTATPTALFRLRGEAFYKVRVRAEQEARAAKGGEVTLAEIYARPCLAGYDPAEEVSAELAACTAYRPVLAAAQRLKQQGKRLYYISDMYLPHTQIDTMLRRCGYTFFDGGFVSCTYGVQKRSGKLFRQFLHETEQDAKQVLFIGDSWRADVIGAAVAGIAAWHLPTPEAPGTNLAAFIENRLPMQKTAGEALGFSVLGPLCVAFCQWLHRCRASRPDAAVYFLARDMYLMQKVYRTLYPGEQTDYLQVSRRSLAPAFLAAGEFACVQAALPRQLLTGKQLADFCGTVCPPAAAAGQFDLKHPDGAELYEFLRSLPRPEAADTAKAYLQGRRLRPGDILVDIGSGGTTQLLLEKLLHTSLHGLQLSADERLRTRFTPERAEVFLFGGEAVPRIYWAGQPMLERLLSEDAGATLGYTKTGGVIIAPHTPEPLLAEVQRGVLHFAAAWRESILSGQPISPKQAVAPFLRLVESPTALQLALLGNLTVEDGGVYPLAAPQSVGHYLIHPGEAKRDFAAARWKIGYLKRLAPLPLPYGRLYLTFKK